MKRSSFLEVFPSLHTGTLICIYMESLIHPRHYALLTDASLFRIVTMSLFTAQTIAIRLQQARKSCLKTRSILSLYIARALIY